MRHLIHVAIAGLLGFVAAGSAAAQDQANLEPKPKPVSVAQLNNMNALDGQLVSVSAVVRHTDTAQVFTFGDKQQSVSAKGTAGTATTSGNKTSNGGREIHVVIPNPATDAAHVGDTVAITGFVRKFDAANFEREYRWFRRTDYPDVHGGDWVIVAVSVRTTEGTELVPPMTISTTPPTGAKTR